MGFRLGLCSLPSGTGLSCLAVWHMSQYKIPLFSQQASWTMTVHSTYTVPRLLMQLSLPAGVSLAEQIVITFCDCTAAGPRLLSALQSSNTGVVSQHPIEVSNAADAKAVLQGTSGTPSPFFLINLSASAATQPQVSYICINTSTLTRSSTHLAAAIVAWIQNRQAERNAQGATSAPVVIAAAAVLSSLKTKGSDALVLPINNASVPQGLSSAPQLPPTTKLQDSFLATLTHSLYVTGQQAVCILVPGYKPSVSGGLVDSVDTVLALSQALASAGLLPGVSCQADAVAGLTLLHRWYAEYEDGPDMMYM